MMTTVKLPEWPDIRAFSEDSVYGRMMTTPQALDYTRELAKAALARMEALVEVVERWDRHMRHREEEDELDAVRALLTACERKEANNVRD